MGNSELADVKKIPKYTLLDDGNPNSKAGKFGTFALYLGLSFGMVGYIAKYFIQYKLGIQ